MQLKLHEAIQIARLVLGEASSVALREELSQNERRAAIENALRAGQGKDQRVWVRDVYSDFVVYEVTEGDTFTMTPDLYKRNYRIEASGKVTLGDPAKVKAVTSYELIAESGDPVQEAGRVLSSKNERALLDACEALAQADKTIRTVLSQLGGQQPDSPPMDGGEGEPMDGCESATLELLGDTVPLVERAMGKDGSVLVKLIQPGWGSSGFYPEEVLKRDGPATFTAGTKMYANHPTAMEEAERPEGDVGNLAAVLSEDAKWLDEGPKGKGLYARAKVFSDHATMVQEKGPFIGVSIRARGKAREGEAQGRRGRIIEKITDRQSVDFVTEAGAGGAVLLSESARTSAPAHNVSQETLMTEQEIKALREAKENAEAKNATLMERLVKTETAQARLSEALLLREAKDFALAQLSKLDIPELTRQRVASSMAKDPPIKEGKLDEVTFAPLIEAEARREMAYIAKVTGSGQVRGLGSTGLGADLTLEEANKLLGSELQRLGLEPATASRAAAGRS